MEDPAFEEYVEVFKASKSLVKVDYRRLGSLGFFYKSLYQTGKCFLVLLIKNKGLTHTSIRSDKDLSSYQYLQMSLCCSDMMMAVSGMDNQSGGLINQSYF